MGAQLTKESAKIIAKKLGAQISTIGAHDVAEVWHNGVYIASFGIRRSSRKDIGHDHISRDLYVQMGFAKQIAGCKKDRDDWVAAMQAIGKIPADPPEESEKK